MGNCSSRPSALCCKKRRRHHWPSSPFTWPAIPGRQRIKCTTPSALHCIPLATDESSNSNGGGGSPRALQRSNAVRRAPVSSRSHSRTPSPHLGPGILRVRNTTPPPPRPTSIVPTLLLTTTPSTNQTSSLSHRCSTAPTSPTTVIGSVHHHAVVCGDADHRPPATLYMVDGEVLGSGGEGDDTSPRYELRWIDALRAPGAGGYRTVVDVVEERRSGRLTVVNGRASLEDQEEEEGTSGGSPGLQQQQQRQQFQRAPEMMAQLRPRASVGQEMGRQQRWDFVPRVATTGAPTVRAAEEEKFEERLRLRRQGLLSPPHNKNNYASSPQSPAQPPTTPIRRKPVPLPPRRGGGGGRPFPVIPSTPPSPFSPGNDQPPPPPPPPRFSTSPHHRVFYQRKRKTMARRPPIPSFDLGPRQKPTVEELLGEVEDARRIVEGRRRGGDNEEGEMRGGKREEEEEVKEWDWFWVDDEEGGKVRYRWGGLVV